VILEGVSETEGGGAAFPLKVEGEIRLVLGDKVHVKTQGIDATLGGEINLQLKGIDNIQSRGEIHVVKGRYKAYGIDLEIVRGRLYYVGDPVDHPSLDILALRTVGEVRAGVTVAGPLGSQVVKLYSEPALPEVDILAYMVLGHPLASGGGDQASLLATAASSLFSLGKSDSLTDQIKDRLGLNVLGLTTVDQTSAGRMGYKEVAVSPTGTASKASSSESLLTVGKFLTPKLYLSYGRSLVTGGNLFQLRYDIFRHWQIETQSGSESGADLYYKLEFN
jgi:translocation and assembly module TamB